MNVEKKTPKYKPESIKKRNHFILRFIEALKAEAKKRNEEPIEFLKLIEDDTELSLLNELIEADAKRLGISKYKYFTHIEKVSEKVKSENKFDSLVPKVLLDIVQKKEKKNTGS